MRRKNAFLSCCLTLCLAVGMTVSVPVSAAAKTSTETQKSYPKYETYYVVNCKESITLRPQPDVSSGELCQIPYGSAVSYIESAQNGFYKMEQQDMDLQHIYQQINRQILITALHHSLLRSCIRHTML